MPAGIVNACHTNNLLCGVWEAAPDYGSAARAAVGYDFYIGQIEGPGQADRVIQSIAGFRAAHPNMPAAIVTNTAGIETREKAAPLVAAGYSCVTETWVRTDGVGPEARVDFCRALGFADPQPFAGLGENGATMADYPAITRFPGYSVFAAEMLWS